MAAPVWVLSVDLQTKTATFQSGMADAAKAARGSFNDIKQGSGEMGRSVGTNMTEARHGVMLLGEEFGIHLPRALTSFIASLGPIGSAMSAAFPFLAIIVGATLLIEHLEKVKKEGEELTASQVQFGITVSNVLGQLDEKLLQAGIRADELNGNHLAALEKQLQLIDHQSLKELQKSFEELAKSSDATMTHLKAHWYEFGSGSEGAKHALEDFQRKYDLLLASNKGKEASDLLAGTLQSAKRILELQQQAKDNQTVTGSQGTKYGDYVKYEAAIQELKKNGTGITEKEVEAQETLVAALQAQVDEQTKNTELKKLEQDNARTSTQNTLDADSDRAFRAQLQADQRAQEEKDKEDERARQLAIDRIQEAERLKIKATKEGTAERLAAIDAAIKDENAKGLQETSYYKDLLGQRVETDRQMAEVQRKLAADAAKEEADHTEKMGELQVAADREKAAVALETKKKGNAEIIASDLELAEREYLIKKKGFEDDIAALDKYAADYQNKLKALQDREAELTKAHENQIAKIKDDAAKQSEKNQEQALNRLRDVTATQLTDVLLRHETFGRMMTTIGSEVASGMLQTAIKSVMALDFGKEREAAAAARKAFLAGWHFPFPANIIAAPTLAAGAFATMMAFAEGGIVPGVELGDVQPAMLTPGETVLPKKMTEKLSRASDDSGDSGQHVHVHHTNHYTVHAIDGASVKGMLQKHSDEFSKHFHAELRRMNR